MRRREFIAGGVAAAWPLAAHAQQPAMPVIGFLGSQTPEMFADRLRAFQQGLSEAGFVDGRNLVIEYRWADNHYGRLAAMAADLVSRQVAVIAVPASTPGAQAAKAATTTIPIVFTTAADPIAVGLVASLSRPGGNLTGVANLNAELAPKQVELMRELFPTATGFALLVNPQGSTLAESTSKDALTAADKLGIKLHVLHASTEHDFTSVFESLVRLRARALIIAADAFLISRSEQLAALTVRHAVPAISQYRPFAAAGGLMSYGGSPTEPSRQAGIYTGRILKGEKPADLPVQQSTKIELFINLKTAKALGLAVPLTLIARADEVIE